MIGQAGVGTQLTDGFVTMADAMLVGIGLVNLLMVILFGSALVPLVTFVALPLVVVGAFVSLAATGRALDLSALIGLLMLRSIVVTNAIVLRDLVQHKIDLTDVAQHLLHELALDFAHRHRATHGHALVLSCSAVVRASADGRLAPRPG
jgi:multidrug efflux pump subunit AcrB